MSDFNISQDQKGIKGFFKPKIKLNFPIESGLRLPHAPNPASPAAAAATARASTGAAVSSLLGDNCAEHDQPGGCRGHLQHVTIHQPILAGKPWFGPLFCPSLYSLDDRILPL